MGILCPFLGAACLWDYTDRRIPNILVFLLWGTGLIYSYWRSGIVGAAVNCLTVFGVFACFYIFFALNLLGAGDVKLLAVAAGFFTGREVLLFIFFSFAAAAIPAVLKLTGEKLFNFRFAGKGIALSGPIFISVILHLGGLF